MEHTFSYWKTNKSQHVTVTTVRRGKGEAISTFGSSRDKQSIRIIIVVKGNQILCYTKEGIILETIVYLSVYCSSDRLRCIAY